MEKLFGTDGIRRHANCYPITAEVALMVGKSLALVFPAEGHGSKADPALANMHGHRPA